MNIFLRLLRRVPSLTLGTSLAMTLRNLLFMSLRAKRSNLIPLLFQQELLLCPWPRSSWSLFFMPSARINISPTRKALTPQDSNLTISSRVFIPLSLMIIFVEGIFFIRHWVVEISVFMVNRSRLLIPIRVAGVDRALSRSGWEWTSTNGSKPIPEHSSTKSFNCPGSKIVAINKRASAP